MIAKTKDPENEFPIVLETTRPNIFDEDSRNHWKKVHKFIKESPIEILINSIFNYIDHNLSNNPNYLYGGGHFKYNFWFKTVEDKEEFLKILKK